MLSSQCYKSKGERRWLLKSMQYDETATMTNKEQAAAEGDYEVFHVAMIYDMTGHLSLRHLG